MNETKALTRRDDELTDLDVPNEGIEEPIVGIRSADELPRDERGRVLGVWHVVCGPPGADGEERPRLRDVCPRVFAACEGLTGDMADRALALGCVLRPGPWQGVSVHR